MKYKSLKKVSAAVRTEIVFVDENNEIEETVIIDYLAKKDEKLDGTHTIYASHAFVPDYVMNAEVELLDANSATGGLYIIAHKAQ